MSISSAAAGLFWLGVSSVCQPQINSAKELLIVDPLVVDHADAEGSGPLSFGSLFTRFTHNQSSQNALRDWLNEWSRTQTESGAPALPRSTEALTSLWPKDTDGKLSLIQTPMILSAILYRPDLEGTNSLGEHFSGEFRFVFNLISLDDQSAKPFSVIFEFPLIDSLPTHFAEKIHHLGTLEFGPEYLKSLEEIVTLLPQKGIRLRTNDLVLAFIWDLREFGMTGDGHVRLQTLPGTPSTDWSSPEHEAELTSWLGQQNQQNRFQLPLTFQTGNSLVPNEGFTWLKDISIAEPVRHSFALQTCNGCHAGETETRFNHISPRSHFGAALVSDFLKADLDSRKIIFEKKLCGQTKQVKTLIDARKRLTH